jgi:hypothetical protein
MAIATICIMTGCSGIPVSSIPRLLQLNTQLLDAKPSEFMLAVQLDARMLPPPGGAPMMEVKVEPTVPGSFEVIHQKLPMRLAHINDSAAVRSLGLQAAPKGRHWLVYSFTPESQAELQRLQLNIKSLLQAKSSGSNPSKGSGKVSVGIAQEGIAVSDPVFASSRWESWLQTRQAEGFFELWSGTVGTLLKQAKASVPSSGLAR